VGSSLNSATGVDRGPIAMISVTHISTYYLCLISSANFLYTPAQFHHKTQIHGSMDGTMGRLPVRFSDDFSQNLKIYRHISANTALFPPI
jgi:hypothetical protein